jgi:hypothetical protein
MPITFSKLFEVAGSSTLNSTTSIPKYKSSLNRLFLFHLYMKPISNA